MVNRLYWNVRFSTALTGVRCILSSLSGEMPRAKEFTPDTVLEQAMELFWEQGYEATSAQDLVDHTGLSRSSLYNTFGSKQELYLRALDHYRQQDGEMFDHLLEQFDSAHGAIRHLLEQACPNADEDPRVSSSQWARSTVAFATKQPRGSSSALGHACSRRCRMAPRAESNRSRRWSNISPSWWR